MFCTVDSKEVSRDRLMRRPMNFGQEVSGMRCLLYRIVLDAAEFLALTEDIYSRFVDEEKEDIVEPGKWPDLDRLRESSYPPLRDLLERDPELLSDIVRKRLFLDILDEIAGGTPGGPQPAHFSLNSLDRVAVEGNRLVLEGNAYSLAPAG